MLGKRGELMLERVLTVGQPKRVFNGRSVSEEALELILHIYLLIANSNGLPQKIRLGVGCERCEAHKRLASHSGALTLEARS